MSKTNDTTRRGRVPARWVYCVAVAGAQVLQE